MDKEHDKRSRKVKVLDVMEKLLTLLMAENGNKEFLTVLEKLLDLNQGQGSLSELRENLTLTFLSCLEHSKNNVNSLQDELKSPFLLRALKKIIVKNANIKLCTEIGHGGFGTVYLGKLIKPNSEQQVAIKVPLDLDKYEVLFDEAQIMSRLDHKNIVKILAFQTFPMMLIMEYLNWQDLASAVRTRPYDSSELLQALHDVVAGMEYLARKKVVHRDLACRNVFVDSSKCCKIGDFGMARYYGNCSGDEYHEKVRLINMYNTAPEAKCTQIFSQKSDVWAFGILAYELYYQAGNMFPFGVHLLNWGGYSLSELVSRPRLCPRHLFGYLDEKILIGDPTERPSFAEIKTKIFSLLSEVDDGDILSVVDDDDDDDILSMVDDDDDLDYIFSD